MAVTSLHAKIATVVWIGVEVILPILIGFALVFTYANLLETCYSL
jgi:hypothetical protein